jgi:hypothetical protein
MNTGRIVGGGLAAGLVMNVLDFLVNGLWLRPRWEAQMDMLNPGLKDKMGVISDAGFIVFDFVLGIALAWLYAAIRPRFGPGPRTAMTAGLVLWVVTAGAFASYWFLGVFTWRLVGVATACGLVITLAGAYVAGMLYKEE